MIIGYALQIVGIKGDPANNRTTNQDSISMETPTAELILYATPRYIQLQPWRWKWRLNCLNLVL